MKKEIFSSKHASIVCYEKIGHALMDPDDATALQQLQQDEERRHDSSNQGQEDGIVVLGCACKYHG